MRIVGNENEPKLVGVNWPLAYRLIASHFPPINLFENVADPADLETIFYIESLTNDRLMAEVGNINLVKKEDWVTGQGSTPIMAAFTHIGQPSRFTDGKHYGIYYAANSLETAIAETVHHREKFMKMTNEPNTELTMRCYTTQVVKPLHDITGEGFEDLYNKDDYSSSQSFGAMMRNKDSYGLVYKSVRDAGGLCVAAFRPTALNIPVQASHYKYVWNNKAGKITHVFQAEMIKMY